MPKPRINPDRPLTPAEKQRAYRERMALARRQELAAKGLPPSPAIPTIPAAPRWAALLSQSVAGLAVVVEEMQAYYDDRSEQWQEGERGEEFSARLEVLSSLLEDFKEALPDG